MTRPQLLAASLTLALAALPTRAEPPSSAALFDPDRHMRLADVRPGMKGYGLSVFHGTRIEKFNVEVVDIVKNFNAGFDAVVVNCPDPQTAHFNSVEGMSGSPIYLYGPDGKPRLIGAYAFGWDFAKDPLIGVQPIEYMLANADPKVARVGSNVPEGPEAGAKGKPRAMWTISDLKPLAKTTASPSLTLLSSGLSQRTADQLAPLFERCGIRPLVASGGGGPTTSAATQPADEPRLEPGSSLVVPLVTGDSEIAALGTCTEVIGDRVFGFGHQFFGEGGCELPMAAGYVNTVIASLRASFKMGGATRTLGVLRADTQVGVAGTLGGEARTVPLTVHVTYDDGSLDRTYRYRVARHPKLTPVLSASSVLTSLNAVRELSPRATVRTAVTYAFPGNEVVKVQNTAAAVTPVELLMELIPPLAAAGENPFAREYPESIDVSVSVANATQTLELLSASTRKRAYHPGDVIDVDVTCRAYHQAPAARRIQVKVPTDMTPGEHSLVISEAARFLQDEQSSRPDKFAATSLKQVFQVVRNATAYPNNAIYARLLSDPAGLAVGHVALPKLPASRTDLLTNANLPDTAPLVPYVSAILPTDEAVTGELELTVTILDPAKHKPAQPESAAPRGQHLPKPSKALPPDLSKLPGDED